MGGASDCNDFGFNFNSGTFRGYLKLSKECTRDLDAGKPLATIGTWYMVAVTSNASHAKIYVNGQFKDINTVSKWRSGLRYRFTVHYVYIPHLVLSTSIGNILFKILCNISVNVFEQESENEYNYVYMIWAVIYFLIVDKRCILFLGQPSYLESIFYFG